MAKRQLKKVLMLTREYSGLAGAGGVKDVSRQLAEALVRKGKQVSVVMPLYGFLDPEALGFKPLDLSLLINMHYVGRERQESVRLWSAEKCGVVIYLIDAERYREKKSIYTYTAEEAAGNPLHRQGMAHYDYFAMNVLLQKAAIAMMIRLGEKPDMIHCHDGHTALVPAMIREIEGYRHYFHETGCLVTIHNAGWGYHQEIADLAFAETITGLPSKVILGNLLDGHFNPFLAASAYGVLNTVSENYARELQETGDDRLTGWLGHRLIDRKVVLAGVTNGINPADYDPMQPAAMGIEAAFSPADGKYAGKARCRAILIKDLQAGDLPGIDQTGSLDSHPKQPLFTFIGRFTAQKGVDKLVGSLETLLPMDKKFQALVLGTGEPKIEEELIALTTDSRYRGRVCLLRGFDPVLANRIYAAGDFFLVPSQYEPCGLTDYIAQLFGNLPIVHAIGGLVKVVDGVTGLAYREHNSAALMGTMLKAIHLFRSDKDKMLEMRRAAVNEINRHYTWDNVVNRYLKLYHRAMEMAAAEEMQPEV
ncbi:MAG: glycogen/starch synthase [Proteobacteria bacterium]|nr:glycogen/starch synthase [Pseudomonadota bacterium]MBU1738273.1 glycogen/starch synthase [Pseudomonadota bacterium]